MEKELRFEVNLFDFTGDIYGHTLTIHWLDKIREMVKFDGIDQLVAQLKEDEAVSRNWTKGDELFLIARTVGPTVISSAF